MLRRLAFPLFLLVFLTTCSTGCFAVHAAQPETEIVFGIAGDLTVTEQAHLVEPVTGDSLLGITDVNNRTIILLKGMSKTQRAIILRHERCHVALADFRFRFGDPKAEEHVCDIIAAGMR